VRLATGVERGTREERIVVWFAVRQDANNRRVETVPSTAAVEKINSTAETQHYASEQQ